MMHGVEPPQDGRGMRRPMDPVDPQIGQQQDFDELQPVGLAATACGTAWTASRLKTIPTRMTPTLIIQPPTKACSTSVCQPGRRMGWVRSRGISRSSTMKAAPKPIRMSRSFSVIPSL
jgi:hypothetical protein